MSDASPTTPRRERFRLHLNRGPHRWIFAFERADAGVILLRLSQLAADPDAPFSEGDARRVAARLQRLCASPPGFTDSFDQSPSTRTSG
jgi:hypothetical protein